MLLHSLPWKKGENFDSILASYVNHVCNIEKDYASCLIIFDVSTKDRAHTSRYPIASLEIQITRTTILTVRKKYF